jgi:hypothetical protein
MPEKKTIERAKRDQLEGKSPSTQAGEFVREEFEHIRSEKHGARSTKQAIAIGLSKARRAGIPLKPPAKGQVSEKTWKSAESAYKKGQRHEPISKTRSVAREEALKRESYLVASPSAISRQAYEAAAKRTPAQRSKAAKKAVATKGPLQLSEAAKKGARTRAKK